MKSFKAMAVFQWTKSEIQITLDYRQINREVEVGGTGEISLTEPKYGMYKVTAKWK